MERMLERSSDKFPVDVAQDRPLKTAVDTQRSFVQTSSIEEVGEDVNKVDILERFSQRGSSEFYLIVTNCVRRGVELADYVCWHMMIITTGKDNKNVALHN